MSCAGKYRRAITLLTITKAFSSAWHQVWLLCSVFGLIQSCFLGTIVNITIFTIMITSSAVMTIMTRYVQCRRRQMPPWYQHKKLPALIHSSHCSGGHYGDNYLLFGQICKIDWNFHWKERHGAGADSVTEHPFVKSECSIKLKKSFRNNPEARTGNAFQVCLQLSLNVGTCFFLPHSFRRNFCFLETYYKALPLGTVCLWKTREGERKHIGAW